MVSLRKQEGNMDCNPQESKAENAKDHNLLLARQLQLDHRRERNAEYDNIQ